MKINANWNYLIRFAFFNIWHAFKTKIIGWRENLSKMTPFVWTKAEKKKKKVWNLIKSKNYERNLLLKSQYKNEKHTSKRYKRRKKITNRILRPNIGFDDETMANYEMAVMILKNKQLNLLKKYYKKIWWNSGQREYACYSLLTLFSISFIVTFYSFIKLFISRVSSEFIWCALFNCFSFLLVFFFLSVNFNEKFPDASVEGGLTCKVQ